MNKCRSEVGEEDLRAVLAWFHVLLGACTQLPPQHGLTWRGRYGGFAEELSDATGLWYEVLGTAGSTSFSAVFVEL